MGYVCAGFIKVKLSGDVRVRAEERDSEGRIGIRLELIDWEEDGVLTVEGLESCRSAGEGGDMEGEKGGEEDEGKDEARNHHRGFCFEGDAYVKESRFKVLIEIV